MKLLVLFRNPVRYKFSGKNLSDNGSNVIIGLHWEPYICRYYQNLFKLIQAVAKKTDPDEPAFPSLSDPLLSIKICGKR